jgi:hypothetical protein
MKFCKLLLAAVGATVLLSALVGTASARNISITNQTIRAQFREVRFEAAFGNTVCQVTLEGSLHARTIAKVANSLIGYITAARLGPCPVGTATILQETLPWHVQYVSFNGTLPNITALNTNVIGSSFRVRETFGVTCLARSTTTAPARGTYNIGAGGVISGARIGGVIPTGAECFGASGTFSSDEGRVFLLNTTTAVSIRLI